MNILIEPLYVGFVQTIISFIFISGFVYCGKIINTKIFKKYDNLLLNLLISIIFFSQIIKIFSYIGLFKQINLIFSLSIFLAGIYNLKFFYNLINENKFYIPRNIFEILILLILFAFFIISIAPPTMADALDYHYGVPLYLLNFNEVPSPYLWVHGASAGNGEFVNSLAIFLGTDNFGTLLQLFSLIFFLLFLKERVQSKKKLLFLYIFILSSPTLLQLISGPKFLLFPQVLTATALFIILEKKKIESVDFIFIGILLMGASQFKLSFLLSGSIIGTFLFLKSFMNNKIEIVIFSLILSVIFFGPTFIWNYTQLDNFSFQNIFLSMPMEAIKSLQNYTENFNYVYPFNLILPNSISSISSILGFQFFILFFIFRNKKETNIIIVITLLTIVLHYFLSMNEARIYYEFILWLAVGVYFVDDKKVNYIFFSKIILIQFLAVFCMALYFATISFPSIFSNEYRDKFMVKTSFRYAAIKWVNKVLPDDAKLISGLRSNALYKNEFVSSDWLSFGISKNDLTGYLKTIEEKKINYIVLIENSQLITVMKNCIGNKYLQSPMFITSTRNPLNRGLNYSVSIFEFNYKNIMNCVK
tara:strand:+ start:1915 stop:3678 length:1764 start_codon:yes stop_codon:yes gene_type:complete